MTHWWELTPNDPVDAPALIQAVAYYRHSAQDRQANSIPIQRDRVCEWAEKHRVEIVEQFADHGKSGLTAEGRPAFTDMMENWAKKRDDFDYVLCLDVSRWGQFQDIDLSAQFSAECKRHRKQVIDTTIGKPREGLPVFFHFHSRRNLRPHGSGLPRPTTRSDGDTTWTTCLTSYRSMNAARKRSRWNRCGSSNPATETRSNSR